MRIKLSGRHAIPASLALLLIAALLSGMRPPSARAQAAAPLSPEQAVLQLLPYRLTAADLPAGYAPEQRPGYEEPIGYALANTPAGGDIQAVFADRRRKGFVVSINQVLLAQPQNGLPAAQLYGYVMSSPDAAWARTEGLIDGFSSSRSVRVQRVDPGISLGDDINAWHIASTDSSGTSSGGYRLRWQRGPLTFSVITTAPYGAEKLQDAVAIARAADGKGQAAAAPSGTTVTPPVTEEQRFADVLQLRSLLGGVAVPDGFQQGELELITPASMVLNPNADPYQALIHADSEERWLADLEQLYTTGDGGANPRLATQANLYSDATVPLQLMAQMRAGDPSDGFFPPPPGLPDNAYAVRIPSASDPSVQTVTVRWAHGPLMLAAQLEGTADQISDDMISSLVAALEASYQASSFAGS